MLSLDIMRDDFSEDYRKLKDLGKEDRKSVLKIIDSLYTKAEIAEEKEELERIIKEATENDPFEPEKLTKVDHRKKH